VDRVKPSAVRFCARAVPPTTLANWLRRLRLTKMTARPFQPQKNEAAQTGCKANCKTIVQAALPDEVTQKRLPSEVWFHAEARVGQQGRLSPRWAPLGSRPAMGRDNRRANASIYRAICPCRRGGAALVMATANTEAMNEPLTASSSQVAPGAHAVPVCDGAGWHAKGKAIGVPAT
jgi:hypothetical protein